MHLENGKFYTTANGTAIKAQLESDGLMHCYDAKGSEQHSCKPDAHVEGWAPVGQAVFQKSREAVKANKGASAEASTDKKKAGKSKN